MRKLLKLIPIIIVFVLLSASCGQKKVYEKFQLFDNNVWSSSQKINFEPEITDTSKLYQVTLSIKVLNTFSEKLLPIYCKVLYPNGEERSEVYNFRFYDSVGKPNGVINDGLRQIDIVAYSKKSFSNIGKYKFELQHGSEKFNLFGIREIGMVIQTVKK